MNSKLSLTNRFAVTAAIALLALTTAPASAQLPNYDFMTVATTGTLSSQFTSQNNRGVIDVTDSFSPGGKGTANNLNSAIFPSLFPVNFPGSGQIQGHLAQTLYDATTDVTFNLNGYQLGKDTVFGIWNATDQVTLPVYQVRLFDGGGNPISTSTLDYIGHEGNNPVIIPQGEHAEMTMNLSNGNLGAGAILNASGIHTDAAFWRDIPLNTKKIVVHGNLPFYAGSDGDGVGYYFADMCPSEGNLADLIADDGSICNGDKTFSNFAYHPIGDMPDASLIDVVSITDSMGNLGIRFIGPFADLPGGGPSEGLLEYQVTVTDPDKLIKDVHLAANTNVLGPNGYAAITETFLPEDSQTVLEAFDLQPGKRMLTDWADLSSPVKSLHVQKDITLYSANAMSLATISFIDQSFSQTPEPTTFVLGAAALVGLFGSRRRSA